MLVTKILEGTLSAGQTTITFTDSAIPNSFIRVGSTNPDLFPTEQSISGNVLTIKYEAQSSALGVVVELVKAGMTINDTLTSTATDEALSANQGKALKDIIDAMGAPSIEELSDVNITDPATDDILIYDGTEEEWVNTSMPNIPADIDDLQDVVITSPSDDDVLTYDNGEWVNKPASGGAGGINYSTTEQDTGLKWIDNKTVYQKTISIGTINAAQGASVDHGITNLDQVISMMCVGFNTAENRWNMVPRVDNAINYQRGIGISSTQVVIGTSSNAQQLTNTYITLQYTKSS